MWIKEEVTSMELADKLWSGAIDTWKQILEADKEDEAMNYCGEESAVDITKINDYLWFESDDILSALVLNKKSKEWCIAEDEYEKLKENGVLSEAHLNVIQESFDIGCHTVYYTELNDAEELSDEEIEELDSVVA